MSKGFYQIDTNPKILYYVTDILKPEGVSIDIKANTSWKWIKMSDSKGTKLGPMELIKWSS